MPQCKRALGVITRVQSHSISSYISYLICIFRFTGGNVKEIPHPDIDWPKFLAFVRNSNSKCHKIFHSTSKKYTHWINIEKLIKVHGDSAGSGTCTTM